MSYESQKKYDEKNNLISKSYKLNKGLVKAFADRCKDFGMAQSTVLTIFMKLWLQQTEHLTQEDK